MGSVTSAFTRTRNALVKVGSQPENHDPERSQSAPESDRGKKRGARFHVSIQTGRQSSRASLSEVLSRQDSGSKKRTSDGLQKGQSTVHAAADVIEVKYCNVQGRFHASRFGLLNLYQEV
ncbi:unnamed protein product [Knipowitschia caucasica]|uniref:Uncharacterized protein n=1 Tax=Knipowitschia caucasica TaxID=637954 RepID=A0AAV2JRK3_KNICA